MPIGLPNGSGMSGVPAVDWDDLRPAASCESTVMIQFMSQFMSR